jgi:hypothetical protein
VAIPVNAELEPGKYTIDWNAENFASGIYYYRIEAWDNRTNDENFVQTKKMILIK